MMSKNNGEKASIVDGIVKFIYRSKVLNLFVGTYVPYCHAVSAFDFLYSGRFSKKLLYKRCTDVNSVSYVGINFCGKLLTLSI